MDTNLFKVSEVCWVVTSSKTSEAQVFKTVETATEYLESIGIPDEEIDYALIDMLVNNNTRANFGVTRGGFIFSDKLRFSEFRGVA